MKQPLHSETCRSWLDFPLISLFDTYIQKEGIADDFGVFDSPDEFYARRGSNLSGLKRWLYSHVIRHRINAQVRRIRAERW